ncbi:MAG: hypothetical protein A3G71_07165 [Gammaproteobacteria bacterium RIFCSPLOWO2_12_FULL_38_14]|nr:MAG: hypothetical protein A3G71_07165 [Gammaproteobacteria bacterium RIFCSPLOWO2_12_FULL_38_14]
MLDLHFIQTCLRQPIQHKNILFNNVSIDSRTLQSGALFIAIRGANFDGHDLLNKAIEKGATAAIVSHAVTSSIPLIIVPDTIKALGQLAQLWRQTFTLPLIAVTGSCGKTTTKSILANILSQKGASLATTGTLNNEIGVPLTLLQLKKTHQFAVIELGANHPGEISYVASLAKPTIALITTIAPVHLEGFGSLEDVAKAKSEIYDALSDEGVAILNHDDTFYDFFKKQNQHRKYFTFGLTKKNNVYASDIVMTAEGFPKFNLHYGNDTTSITLPLLGKHNVTNALAAACAALSLEIALTDVKKGLESIIPEKKRMNRYTAFNQATLFDDTYNANPTAFLAALDFLTHQPGNKILVVGDMGELGSDAVYYHEQLGKQAKNKGIHCLLALGPLSAYTVNAFGNEKTAKHFENKIELIAYLKKHLTPKDTVLIKGSRSTKMEEVVEALKGE